jgi:hypothetical protein
MIPEGFHKGYLIGHTSNYLCAKTKGTSKELNTLKKIIIKKINYPYIEG